MARKIGVVGIGQSPRDDLIPEIYDLCGGVELVERGALDGLSLEEIKQLAPEPGDYVLVTRLRDASSVRVAKKHIHPRVEKHINDLVKQGMDGILLLCTGEFPDYQSGKLILYPQRLLKNFVNSIAANRVCGILTPDASQVKQTTSKWHNNGVQNVVVQPATPYGDIKNVREAARALKQQGAELVVMDCMGYNIEMKELVSEVTGLPVVLPRTLAARAVAELFGLRK